MAVKERERTDEYRALMPLFHQLASDSASRARREHIRAKLITEHLPVAEHIARKFRNRGQSTDDLEQVARVGLINAVDRFDPKRGNDFLSFAVPTITGEVRRYFRDATWSVRVPRRLKELHADITACVGRLSQRLGRAPRPSEIAGALHLPVEEVYEGLQVSHAYYTESLDDSPSGEGNQDAGRLAHIDGRLDLVEDREALIPALAKLPVREATILAMRFYSDMTQTQIAERIGISQMHVSRLLAATLRKLRTTMLGESTGLSPVGKPDATEREDQTKSDP